MENYFPPVAIYHLKYPFPRLDFPVIHSLMESEHFSNLSLDSTQNTISVTSTNNFDFFKPSNSIHLPNLMFTVSRFIAKSVKSPVKCVNREKRLSKSVIFISNCIHTTTRCRYVNFSIIKCQQKY